MGDGQDNESSATKRNKQCVGGEGRRKVTLPERVGKHSQKRQESRVMKTEQAFAGQEKKKKKTSTLGRKNSISKSSESRKGMKKVSITKTKYFERPPGSKLG